jgi:homocitrate synthase NifV
MSLNFQGEKPIILDKSLSVMLKDHSGIDNAYLIEFLRLMRIIGVNYFEVNSEFLDKILFYPKIHDYYVYKIENLEDLKRLYMYDFKYLSIDFERFYDIPLMDYKNKINKSRIIINIKLSDLNECNIENLKYIQSSFNVKYLMVTSLSKCNEYSLKDFILKLKNIFNIEVGFCAENSLYMGTAISIEAFLDGADIIAGAFNGEEHNLTSLEEVLTALKVINNCDINGDLRFLSKLTNIYEELTRKCVLGNKAVIGKDIFKYESGIHADGIEKNPLTYEPYNPMEVGQKRELLIGKHSGIRAIIAKLKQLDVNCSTDDIDLFLSKVRNKSIYLKRSLTDDELLRLYGKFHVQDFKGGACKLGG